ncbi:Transcriptional regulator containing HTH domain, ArsR family [Halomicrobium sp. LC1Hm]|nr:Transcriptional regulator containing HTH domain, ArsR family [Halomicrobium sp. LC1Hm]
MADEYGIHNRLSLIPRRTHTSDTATEMARNDDEVTDDPPVAAVLASLDDEKCRAVLAALREPKSATELQGECDLASSTVYRKLEQLREAALVREYTEVRRDGPNATLYERDFTDISISIDDEEAFRVAIERPERELDDPEDRMATFWSEMRKQS